MVKFHPLWSVVLGGACCCHAATKNDAIRPPSMTLTRTYRKGSYKPSSLSLPLASNRVSIRGGAAGLENAAKGVAALPSLTASAAKTLFAIRGGAGPFNVDMTARAATIFFAFYSCLVLLFPQQVTQGYGITDVTPSMQFAGRNAAIALVSISLTCICRVFGDTSVNTAVGISMIPRILGCIHALVKTRPTQFAYPQAMEYVNLALYSIVAYMTTCKEDSKHAMMTVKIVSIYTLCVGAAIAIFPNGRVAKLLYGGVADDDDDELLGYLWKNTGCNFLWLGVLLVSLANGVVTTEAIGLSWMVGLFYLLSVMFVTREVAKFEMHMGPFYAWLVIVLVVVGTLADTALLELITWFF